ncbi:uncharacterized protein A4U43_C08F16470 [Asparagus officinalis]|uniref:zinc finger protein ZAT4-like n=1 Tax=Asparagus officinalis TaxID=4686 RepID=UPI00098E4076|nr:zinc finger protein ZAT4-like [Asparagus officinalis]ONK60281.1 uncharacterized protein A4U43_C08F16470 [Asparagus officinalis]
MDDKAFTNVDSAGQSESDIEASTSSRNRSRPKRMEENCDDKEKEDGAMILVMLSRNSFEEYSDELKKRNVSYGVSELGRGRRFPRFDDEDYNAIDSDKRRRYKCKTCDKTFNSYQALGGHRTSHNLDRNLGVKTVKKPKKGSKDHHECSFCGKVFPSGQALGGHKRSHWNSNSIDAHLNDCNDEDYGNMNGNSEPSRFLLI